ncbi:MAG: AMMECR1 domain-containing protein, partial [Myxococcota bacterium]
MLSETRTFLLALARDAILAHTEEREWVEPPAIPEGAALRGGCFVSLHRLDGTLRGCVGTFDASQALWRNVVHMAVGAASRDPRFSRLSREELDRCVIEISALSPPT